MSYNGGRILEEEIPTCVEDEEFFEDIQDVYDQLYVQYLKQQYTSKAQICGIEAENKSLLDQVRFLERQCYELVEPKNNLDSKCAKLDKNLCESIELSNRLPQSNEKFDRMLSMSKSVGDKHGICYTNGYTHTSFKTVFRKGITNPSPPQVGTNTKDANKGKGRHSKNKFVYKAQASHKVCYTCGEHGHHAKYCMKNRDVLNKKLVQLANQSKALNSHVLNFSKLLEKSCESNQSHASPSKGPQARVHKASSTPKVKVDLHTSKEKKAIPPPILQPNPSLRKEKQVWVTNEDFEKLTISTKLEALSVSNEVIAPET
ncbi:unnamed protein product [Ilex paraguariensis]|uniref:CCHC-type domain-containing protein n=1 Tax=Ilex paraguariensis TaxID=185542 RepID=A0ABC8SM90_9AQUA